jgi:4-amino-4-deoxy-L-arabinose transferase-like glycosyltransferase
MALNILWLTAIAAAAFGYGALVARALKLELPTRLDRAVVSMALGAGALVVLMFALGLLHLFRRGLFMISVVPAAVFGAASFVRALRDAAPRADGRTLGRAGGAVLAALLASVAANFFGTLAPVSFIDALFYHLFIARTYAEAGRIVEIPAIWQSYQPMGIEMLYTLAHGVRGPIVAALIHAALGVLAAGGAALIGRRLAGRMGGLLAAAIFYCTAMTAWESTSCFIELGTAAFSTVGVYALLRFGDDDRQLRWLVAAALLLGCAGICKLTAAQMPVIAAPLVAWISWRQRRSWAVVAGRVALFGGIALAFSVPWYVHSYLWSGNPVYPFATRLFGDNSDYAQVWSILDHYGPGRTPKDLLLAPWRLLAAGDLFENGQFLSPLPVVLAPVIARRLCLKGSRDRRMLAVLAVLAFLIWLSSAHIARYLVPMQPLAAVLAADALVGLAGAGRWRLRLAVATAALFIGFGTASTLAFQKKFALVVLGRVTPDAYLARNSWFYAAYRMVVASVPANGKVLTNMGPTYYLDRPHVRIRDDEFQVGADRLAQVLADGHFTHVFVHGNLGLEPVVAALGPRVRLLWRRDFEMAVSRTFGGTTGYPAALYEVVAAPAPAPPAPAALTPRP